MCQRGRSWCINTVIWAGDWLLCAIGSGRKEKENGINEEDRFVIFVLFRWLLLNLCRFINVIFTEEDSHQSYGEWYLRSDCFPLQLVRLDDVICLQRLHRRGHADFCSPLYKPTIKPHRRGGNEPEPQDVRLERQNARGSNVQLELHPLNSRPLETLSVWMGLESQVQTSSTKMKWFFWIDLIFSTFWRNVSPPLQRSCDHVSMRDLFCVCQCPKLHRPSLWPCRPSRAVFSHQLLWTSCRLETRWRTSAESLEDTHVLAHAHLELHVWQAA